MQEDFKEYLKEARQRFCKEVNKYNVSDNLQLRTECDSFLIAYDQAVAKAFSLQGVSHRRELLELVTEIANSNQVYSNTRHKLWAKKLISSNCG
jgi:hypothetical protein